MTKKNLVESEKTDANTENRVLTTPPKDNPKPTTSTDGAGEVVKPIGVKEGNPKKE